MQEFVFKGRPNKNLKSVMKLITSPLTTVLLSPSRALSTEESTVKAAMHHGVGSSIKLSPGLNSGASKLNFKCSIYISLGGEVGAKVNDPSISALPGLYDFPHSF
jgi:hypothetical protein